MRNYNLAFIGNQDLYNHVKETVEKYCFEINLKKFKSNLVDPIKLTFDSKVYAKELKDVIENEIIRQIDKSNTNHIGYFNQNIFKYIGDKWEVPERGFDIVNEEDKIFVEMKNKHNTMNSSSSQKTYMRMSAKLNSDPGATCMLVEVIAKKSQNIKWNVSLDGESVSNENIRRVSIDKFYELVTGEPDAFKKLCEALPMVIDDVISSREVSLPVNTVADELMEISPNLLKSMYMISFSRYEGFDSLEM